MKVVVALKETAVVDDAFEIEDDRVPERYLEYELNEWDEYALETAVQLQEAGTAGEVVTVTIGPARAEETIRKALAKGADRAIRIWDDALAELAFLDVHAKTALLASVLADEQPRLVLTGVQSGDDLFGATGVALAEQLGYSWAAVVTELSVQDEEIRAHRELEGGVAEITSISLPAVCTIQTGINEPRYASLRGIRMAQRAEIEERSLADLELDPSDISPKLELVGQRTPEVESTAEIYEGTPTETAGRLATFLRERGVAE